jgi:CheY-like chemotaxis protein
MRTRTRVLIVEDVPLQLDIYETALRDAGYAVLRATGGRIGYAVAVTERPDVIVADLDLPDIDGSVMCAWLAANPATAAIPVIILTASDEHAVLLRAPTANVVARLHKSCPIMVVTDAIEKAVRTSGAV